MGTSGRSAETRAAILDAARLSVLASGSAGLSTRRIAAEAGVPLSQLHYHFGSKRNLVLAILEAENERLLARQSLMYGDEVPLWKRWEQACDFLEDDLASGYVRILHEMIAAGWSDPVVAERVRGTLAGWYGLLRDVAAEAEGALGTFGPFGPAEVASLAVNAFLGAEATILVGIGEHDVPTRAALRRVGELIRIREEADR